MFGPGGFGGGYGRFREEYENGPPRRNPGNMYNNAIYNWPKTFAPPPPPPAVVNCGELRRVDVGKIVEISGRVHKVSSDRFVQIKDALGMTQLVIPPERNDMQNRFKNMPLHSFVTVLGEVHARPLRGHNEKMATGTIEVLIEEVLNVQVNKSDNRPKTFTGGPRHYIDDGTPPKITSEEYHKFQGLLPQLSERKYTCAQLFNMMNETVSLLGWVDKSSKKFVTLADGYGKIQCVVPSNNEQVTVLAENLTPNAVVTVTGKVTERPKSQVNNSAFNGNIELQIATMDWPNFDLENISKEASDEGKAGAEDGGPLSALTGRTHTCDELRAAQAGQNAVLCGWLQFIKADKFVLLRDSYGTTQCVISQQGCEVNLSAVPLDSVLKVSGVVAVRPPNMINDNMKTGEIEVIIKEVAILSKANKLPFLPNPVNQYEEEARLRHRYLDLRFPHMLSQLRLRSDLLQNMRRFLSDKHQFLEVDTPSLTAPLSVMSSLSVEETSGQSQRLVHYPFIHLHYLMIGQMDRCFNISKVYLPKPQAGQSESTRLHLAMCFTDLDNMMFLVERLLQTTFPKAVASGRFTALTEADALLTYGSTTPDLSYDLKLYQVTEAMTNVNENNEVNFGAYALIYPLSIGKFSNEMKSLLMVLKTRYSNVQISLNVARDISALVENSVRTHMKLDQSNSYILAHGNNDEVCRALGSVRAQLATELAARGLLHRCRPGVRPAWLLEPRLFPGGAPGPHALSAVHADDRVSGDLLQARAMGFSLVMNGDVYAEGYLPNNDPDVLQKQLGIIKFDQNIADNLLQAVQSGSPPCVIASIDIDKLAALACDVDSVREVIAFPKSEQGKDCMAVYSAPNPTPIKKHELMQPKAKIPKLM